MESLNQENNEMPPSKSSKERMGFPPGVVIVALIAVSLLLYTADFKVMPQNKIKQAQEKVQNEPTGETLVIPLPSGNLGLRMIEAGVIDRRAFEAVYAERGGLTTEEKNLLTGQTNDLITVNQKNAGFILNFLWAFGLGNKNPILESGPMADTSYGSPDRFASTGGWTIANGNIMNHYSAHPFVVLTKEQQTLVERVSKNIYRPCCDNATYFPDCNHGMAMLGLLELLAAANASEQTMYKVALQMNIFWFPEQYTTIAEYLRQKGQNIESANPKEILGINYSSASGYRGILQAVNTHAPNTDVNCDVGGSESIVPKKSSGGGCGI